ncbi:MAG TPA: Ig-like domain-containing protein, partial [Armatimonadota bacterium]|nr:Ig-like domain-containing protein [Armatimonadota bacterium]
MTLRTLWMVLIALLTLGGAALRGAAAPAVITGPAGMRTVNQPPTVALTAPADGATALPGATVELTADAADADGTVAKVEFFQGTTKLGEDDTAPFGITWSGVPQGVYSLTAVATDNEDATATSAAVTLRVSIPPTVALLTPSSGAQVYTGSTQPLRADAADQDGSITKVEFFQGTTKLSEATTGPFAYTWA